MVKIELEPLEHKDIIDYLKYAIEQKQIGNVKKDYRGMPDSTRKFNTTKYDIDRIKFLIKVLSSKNDRTILNKKGVGEGNVYSGSTRF